MDLNKIKKVDLKRSDVNWEASDPLNGKYVFRKKVYITDASYASDALRPPDVLKWVTDNDETGDSSVLMYKYEYGAEEVTMEDKDYWPEPLKPDENHHYKFPPDALLMKIPLERQIDKIEADQKATEAEATGNRLAYLADAERAGAGLGGDSSVDKILEDTKGKVRF